MATAPTDTLMAELLAENARLKSAAAPAPGSRTTLYVGAVMGLSALAVVAVVALAITRPDEDNSGLNTLIIAFLVPSVSALLAAGLKEVHHAVNGATEKVRLLTERASFAEGKDQGRKESDATVDLQNQAAIIAAAHDVIISKTLDGIITSWNAEAHRLFGYTAEEAVGQSILLIVPTELRDEEEGIMNRLRKGERIDHFETIRVAKDGRRIALSLTISPIRDATGRVVGASKIARELKKEITAAPIQVVVMNEPLKVTPANTETTKESGSTMTPGEKTIVPLIAAVVWVTGDLVFPGAAKVIHLLLMVALVLVIVRLLQGRKA